MMKNTKRCLSLFLALVLTTSVVSAISKQNQEILDKLKRLNKPAVKSIKSSDGDIIDCVKLADQPAFDHPLLKNHKIQLSPTFSPESTLSNKSKQTDGEAPRHMTQVWHLSGSCPEGTIPIRRTKKSDILRERSFANKNLSTNSKSLVQVGNEFAVGYVNNGRRYFGTHVNLNVWKPQVYRDDEYSKTQIWVIGAHYNTVHDSMEAGWHVSPEINGDRRTRFFYFWTNNGYKTGCYNLICAGFVQVSRKIVAGGTISPVSIYNSTEQREINLLIKRDFHTGNWWLKTGDEEIGYWPNSLFSKLQNGASIVGWGGVVQNNNFGSMHTTTEMGSGGFAQRGFGKSSYINHILVVDKNGGLIGPPVVSLKVNRPDCYNITAFPIDSNWGTYIYFGGYGRNMYCV